MTEPRGPPNSRPPLVHPTVTTRKAPQRPWPAPPQHSHAT